MKGAYATYFDNLFLGLRMGRPAYKAQAEYCLRAVREAAPGPAFIPLLADLDTAIKGFDENLTDRNLSTAGGTADYRRARKAWLTFVEDTMKDYVTPKLRKLPVYDDFKQFGKSKLAKLDQATLITQSKALLSLYLAQQDALYPHLVTDGRALYKTLLSTDEARDTQAATITDAILDLAADRAAIARAQRRLKA
jgi:hypothetical protein